MNERGLRTQVEKRRRITDEEWSYLHRKGFVGEALDRGFDEDKIEYMISEIDQLPNRASKSRTSGEEGQEETTIESEPFDVKLTDAETERARWLLDIQIRYATEDPHVAEFRERNLSNGLLSHKEAEEFLGSANAREATAVASHLKKFHGWHEGEATWWMLTGESPSARPLRVSYRESHSRFSPDLYLIGLEAPPWISVETLAGAFAEMKRRMNAEKKLPDARSYRAARFIEARLHKAGANKPTFEDMRREWNQENPGEKFPDYRTFRKVYDRIPVERITYPAYTTNIERPVTPEMQRQLHRSRKKHDQVVQRFKNRGRPVSKKEIPEA
jgi:hypothetical protein